MLYLGCLFCISCFFVHGQCPGYVFACHVACILVAVFVVAMSGVGLVVHVVALSRDGFVYSYFICVWWLGVLLIGGHACTRIGTYISEILSGHGLCFMYSFPDFLGGFVRWK